MLREPAAIGSWLVLFGAAMTTTRARATERLAVTLTMAALFFMTAAATRYWLRETRSRWQITAFVVFAGLVALQTHRKAGRLGAVTDWLVWVVAAALGVMLVRWRTEGSPI